MGLMGSLHCAVMCGPLMLGLPVHKSSHLNSVLQVLLYQAGRVLIYVFMGLLVGWIGNSITVFVNQQMFSLSLGVVLVAFTFLQFSTRYTNRLNKIQYVMAAPISKLMGKIFGLPFWGFFAGMLNGLIPCGMVYLALATALHTTSVKGGATFMFLFGLGTTPLMILISLGGIYLRKYILFNSKKLVSLFMLFVGVLLILRSANLSIPFLSPMLHSHSAGSVKVCN
jgi:sulfite exporter TauE/SafE